MSFGYFPDYKNKNILADTLLKIIGYPYPPRRNEARLVIKELDPKHGEKILDVGCGDGIFTNDLIKRGYDITGLDISDGALKIAKERAQKMELETAKVKYIKASAGKMPFKDNSFDKIFSISTFEHIKDDDAAFKECVRVLKPGGIFILSVPTPKIMPSIKYALKFSKNVKKALFNSVVAKSSGTEDYRQLLDKKYSHYRNYTLEMINTKCEKSGFKIDKVGYNIKFFSVIPHSIIHTFKVFEWEKSKKDKYTFVNEAVIALTFPLFYPLYILDDIIKSDGYSIVVKCCK